MSTFTLVTQALMHCGITTCTGKENERKEKYNVLSLFFPLPLSLSLSLPPLLPFLSHLSSLSSSSASAPGRVCSLLRACVCVCLSSQCANFSSGPSRVLLDIASKRIKMQ